SLELMPSMSFLSHPPPPYRTVETTDKFVLTDTQQVGPITIAPEVMSELNDDITFSRRSAVNNPNKSLFSGWEVQPLIGALNNAFLLTHSTVWLDEISFFFDYFDNVRMSTQSRVNFDGRLLPQWERIDRYNIFYVSPFYDYSSSSVDDLMHERQWASLYFSDVNYSGLMLGEFLRAAQIIQDNRVVGYDDLVGKIISTAEAVVRSHDSEWVEVQEGRGFYKFPDNSPFFLDGVEMPINEAAAFGSSLVRLYILTGKQVYLDRAANIWRHWRETLFWDAYGYLYYPYVNGVWQKGWTEDNSPSVNTPMALPEIKPETFHKAGLTIEFFLLLNFVLKDRQLDLILEEFQRVMKAVLDSDTRPASSEFPRYFGFYYPIDSVHWSPAHYAGWMALMSKDEAWSNSLLINWAAGLRNSKTLLQGAVLNPELFNRMSKISEESIVVKPGLTSMPDQDCSIASGETAIAEIKFQHTSPKNNKLYLEADGGALIRLKIDTETGYFRGRMFLLKERCNRLEWVDNGIYSMPSSDEENKLEMTVYSLSLE
ncbi:hypothetical protein, partial [Oleiphilus sp. HI0079]|uniref:hypothetical protein n=3 Tax=unclassified Oleiphilus TaxID=2631174 RepID=UPI000AF7000B